MNKIKLARVLSSNFSKLKRESSFTSREIAIKTGATIETITKIERGYFIPSFALIVKMSEIFNVSVDKFLS